MAKKKPTTEKLNIQVLLPKGVEPLLVEVRIVDKSGKIYDAQVVGVGPA